MWFNGNFDIILRLDCRLFKNVSVTLWWPLHLSMLSWSSVYHFSTQHFFSMSLAAFHMSVMKVMTNNDSGMNPVSESEHKVLHTRRKHCGKWRNCSLRTISPFPTVPSKDLYCRHLKTRPCFGKGQQQNFELVQRTMVLRLQVPGLYPAWNLYFYHAFVHLFLWYRLCSWNKFNHRSSLYFTWECRKKSLALCWWNSEHMK